MQVLGKCIYIIQVENGYVMEVVPDYGNIADSESKFYVFANLEVVEKKIHEEFP